MAIGGNCITATLLFAMVNLILSIHTFTHSSHVFVVFLRIHCPFQSKLTHIDSDVRCKRCRDLIIARVMGEFSPPPPLPTY
jgi:hypothetical protein